MKVIDLLNKIANGEKIPEYINYTHKAFGKDTMMVCKENIINKLDIGAIELNDEVEILEEDKKIEMIKIDEIMPSQEYCYTDYVHYTREEITELIRERLYEHERHMVSLDRAINKIIDKINGDS